MYCFQERMAYLLEYRVAMLKLVLSVRRMLYDLEPNGPYEHGMATDLSALVAAWDDAYKR